ncbi:MAG: peptidoglycan-binding protein [Pseudomonadota bacterium]
MPMRRYVSTQRITNDSIWPGFVDALSTLLMVIIFILMIFAVAQFFLAQTVTGRDEVVARLMDDIEQLEQKITLAGVEQDQLERNLSSAQERIDEVVGQRDLLSDRLQSLEIDLRGSSAQVSQLENQTTHLSAQVQEQRQARETLRAQLQARTQDLEQENQTMREGAQADAAQLASLREALGASQKRLENLWRDRRANEQVFRQDIQDLEHRVTELTTLLARRNLSLDERRRALLRTRAESRSLQDSLDDVAGQLLQVQQALEMSEAAVSSRDIEITNLTSRINQGLIRKVEELNRYRSEFFGRVRDVIGARDDIQIVGDRFVLSAEVLFPSGSARLTPEGTVRLEEIAQTVLRVAQTLPDDVPWVLRVDGHTDRVPINTPRYPSNWELSTSRATSVVRFLISQGFPADRLAAAGFADQKPIDPADTPQAYSLNRRIELRIDQGQ